MVDGRDFAVAGGESVYADNESGHRECGDDDAAESGGIGDGERAEYCAVVRRQRVCESGEL